jgi:putative transposase
VLPPFLRRTKNVEELLPRLYLKGVSTGQFEEALAALLGPGAPELAIGDGTSPRRGLLTAGPSDTDRRACWPPMVASWQQEHESWQRRDLGTRRYVYLWVGVRRLTRLFELRPEFVDDVSLASSPACRWQS